MDNPHFFFFEQRVENELLETAVDPHAVLQQRYREMQEKIALEVGRVVLDGRSYCVHAHKSATSNSETLCMELYIGAYLLLTDFEQAEVGEWVFTNDPGLKDRDHILLSMWPSRPFDADPEDDVVIEPRLFIRRVRYFQRTK